MSLESLVGGVKLVAQVTLEPVDGYLSLVGDVTMLNKILAHFKCLQTKFTRDFRRLIRISKMFVLVRREKEGADLAEPPDRSQAVQVALVSVDGVSLLVVEPCVAEIANDLL